MPVPRFLILDSRWLMFALASAFFFFITASTFSSLGVVLLYVIEEFSWTWSQAGTGFFPAGAENYLNFT